MSYVFFENDNNINKNIKKLQEVNIIIGRFQPFHNGHLKLCKEIYKTNKTPIVIVCVYSGNEKLMRKRNEFKKPVLEKILSRVVKYEDEIIDYIFVQKPVFDTEVLPKLREKGYEPILLVTGPDRYNSYNKMIKSLEKNGKIKLNDAFKIIKVNFKKYNLTDKNKKISASDIRNVIKNGNKYEIEKIRNFVPEYVYKLFREIKNAMYINEMINYKKFKHKYESLEEYVKNKLYEADDKNATNTVNKNEEKAFQTQLQTKVNEFNKNINELKTSINSYVNKIKSEKDQKKREESYKTLLFYIDKIKNISNSIKEYK